MQSSSTNLMDRAMEAGRRKSFFFQYLLMFAVLIFCIYQYSIHKIFGFSLYPDEFGYWASAAEWIGYDWSGAASIASYYSFGYSLILAPILKLCRDGVFAYRVAVTVNMLMQCICIGLLWGIFIRLYRASAVCGKNMHIKEAHAVFAVGIAVFYPVWGFYAQMTMAESLLTFLYVFICYQFVLLFEKPKMISVILLSLSFLYLYFVHMRTIGTVLAGIAVLLLYLWFVPEHRKFLIPCIVVLLIGAGCGAWIKKLVTGSVYAAADAAHLAGNDYAGQAERLKELLSSEGILKFLMSFVGKLYYLGMASFGLFYAAVWFCGRRVLKLFRNIFRKPQEDLLFLFLILSMLGQVLISSIYTSAFGRLDGVVYGRYNEYLLPVYIGIGVLALFEHRYLLRYFFTSVGISTCLFGVVIWNVLHSEAMEMYGFHAAALSYLSDDIDSFRAIPEFCKAYLFGLLLMAFMIGCIAIAGRYRRNLFMICPALLVEIALMLCLSNKYTCYFNDIDYQDLKIYEYIEDSRENEAVDEAAVSYLYGGGRQYIDLIQFAMQDESVAIVKECDDSGQKIPWEELSYRLPDEGFLIVDADSEYLEKLEETYQKCIETASFILFSAK